MKSLTRPDWSILILIPTELQKRCQSLWLYFYILGCWVLHFPRSISFMTRYNLRCFEWVGHDSTFTAIGNHHFFHYTISSSYLRELLRTFVKSVNKCQLCTGLTEVLNNFGRSDDDMVLCPTCTKNLEWYLIDSQTCYTPYFLK